ncbi:hypothetical protein [Micromonospora arida]|uniref:hypothetical protein n=1 Tax=Micromonospora arida TaxID=2203715 RepID=UPI003F4BCA19
MPDEPPDRRPTPNPAPREPRPGEVLHLTRAASVQFLRPIFVRVIRVLDWPTYDGWLWIDCYERCLALPTGSATSRDRVLRPLDRPGVLSGGEHAGRGRRPVFPGPSS